MTKDEIIGGLDKINVSAYALQNLTNFVNGQVTRKKNGNLLITLELPANTMQDHCKGIPTEHHDWKYVPLILFAEHKEKGENENVNRNE